MFLIIVTIKTVFCMCLRWMGVGGWFLSFVLLSVMGFIGQNLLVLCIYHTVHCTLSLYTVHCTLYTITVHCTLYTITVHCTLYTLNCTLYTVHCTLYTVHCTLYTVYCTLYT